MSDLPKNLEECFQQLQNNILTPEDQIFMMQMEEDDLASLHMTLGLWIRNNWIHLDGKSVIRLFLEEKGLQHPDDMSGLIITSFYRHLLNKDLNIEEQINEYKKYWEKKIKYDILSRINSTYRKG